MKKINIYHTSCYCEPEKDASINKQEEEEEGDEEEEEM